MVAHWRDVMSADAFLLKPSQPGWRQRLYLIIFEADTPAGKRFDVALLIAILASVLVVVLDSVTELHRRFAPVFFILECTFTGLFTLEYLLRLVCVARPWRYARSLFGIVDLLSILPTYWVLLFPTSIYFINVRILRLFRAFRVLKLVGYLNASHVITEALRSSRRKILLFMLVMLINSIVLGTLIYIIEGPVHGFTSIPRGIYWAIITMTTLGYGDLVPHTSLGQALSSAVTLLGYGVLAVPTGIVSAEFARVQDRESITTRMCQNCCSEGHLIHARFCRDCGAALPLWSGDL